MIKYGREERCTQVLVRVRGKHRRKLKDNVKFGFLGIGWGVYWINLAQDTDKCRDFVNAVTKLR
jgi:hypothetical protein